MRRYEEYLREAPRGQYRGRVRKQLDLVRAYLNGSKSPQTELPTPFDPRRPGE